MGTNAEQKVQEMNDLLQTEFYSVPNSIAVMHTLFNAKRKLEDSAIRLINYYTLKWISNVECKGELYGEVAIEKSMHSKRFIEIRIEA